MRILKNGHFWGGVIVGVVLCYVYSNHLKGRSMG
jgi:hypothetical protein